MPGDRDAAWIGVLDDHARRRLELPHAFEGGVAVRDVVVRELLALKLRGRRDRGADRARVGVERRLLVRILAVAQVQALAERQVQIVGKGRRFAADGAGKIGRHHRIVLRGVRKRLRRKLLAHRDVGRALIRGQFVEQTAVIARDRLPR